MARIRVINLFFIFPLLLFKMAFVLDLQSSISDLYDFLLEVVLKNYDILAVEKFRQTVNISN